MTATQTFLIDNLLSDLLKVIMEDRKVSMQAALDILYTSRLYALINNVETGLYLQSADYNYELLQEELGGKQSPVACSQEPAAV